MVVVLGLDHRNGVVGTEIQEIICPLWFLPEDHVSPQINLAVGDLGLHGDLAPAPLGGHSGGNVLEFDVLLCHIFFGKIGCTSTTSFMVRKLGGYIPDIF